ncbi:MAG: TlpA disulfide reductase family protein [Bdellovibrionales bacterium]|jgi:thiol-disulfide isomerase/thioredoxin|nr:TlpA disulfide reductase family protein [Bdellovibrionales bacterium]
MGKSFVIVVVGLIAGSLVLLGLLVLRTKEINSTQANRPLTRVLKALHTPPQTNEAGPQQVRVAPESEIHSWIVASMQNEADATSSPGAKPKIGIVNIWATWCEPCRKEMPELVRLQQSGLAPLFLISADNESDLPSVKKFLTESGVTFESALVQGDQQVFVESWQRRSSSDPGKQWSMTLPVTFLVNASGQVLSFRAGETTFDELKTLIQREIQRETL